MSKTARAISLVILSALTALIFMPLGRADVRAEALVTVSVSPQKQTIGQGDIIKIKVGKKTYTKKVGSKPKYKYTQKIKKQKKGTRIKVTVYNKFKQIRCTKTIKVKK